MPKSPILLLSAAAPRRSSPDTSNVQLEPGLFGPSAHRPRLAGLGRGSRYGAVTASEFEQHVLLDVERIAAPGHLHGDLDVENQFAPAAQTGRQRRQRQ